MIAIIKKNYPEIQAELEIENPREFSVIFFSNVLDLKNDRVLEDCFKEINKIIDEYYNILSEQANEYINLFLLIFECYLTVHPNTVTFEIIQEGLISFLFKSLKNKSEEMIYIFNHLFIKKLFNTINDRQQESKIESVCWALVTILSPSESQQVDFFKLFKDNIKNEETMYLCFRLLHSMLNPLSEQLIDKCLFYVINGLSSCSTEIRTYSLSMLNVYCGLNSNFIFSFRSALVSRHAT